MAVTIGKSCILVDQSKANLESKKKCVFIKERERDAEREKWDGIVGFYSSPPVPGVVVAVVVDLAANFERTR